MGKTFDVALAVSRRDDQLRERTAEHLVARPSEQLLAARTRPSSSMVITAARAVSMITRRDASPASGSSAERPPGVTSDGPSSHARRAGGSRRCGQPTQIRVVQGDSRDIRKSTCHAPATTARPVGPCAAHRLLTTVAGRRAGQAAKKRRVRTGRIAILTSVERKRKSRARDGVISTRVNSTIAHRSPDSKGPPNPIAERTP